MEKINKRISEEDRSPEDKQQYLDIYSSVYSMRQDLERIKKPQGTKDNPVRTCRDLYFGHPTLKDGKKLNLSRNE